LTNFPNSTSSTAPADTLGSPANPYAAAPKRNTLAIVAVITGFLVPLVGVICGHISLSQIKRTGESGRGLALTGVIAGYCLMALYLLLTVVGMVAAASIGSTYVTYD
jgi:Domain of unknown function (DUF4190)